MTEPTTDNASGGDGQDVAAASVVMEEIETRPVATVKRRPMVAKRKSSNVPALRGLSNMVRQLNADIPEDLPNSSLIYGVAGAVLATIALFFIFSGHFMKGFLVLIPAAGFVGFAMYFMKYR